MHITGFHGTTVESCNNILKRNFAHSHKVGWLGTGTYFFEGNPEMAKYYPTTKSQQEDIQVLQCEIVIPDDKVFDVTDPNIPNNKLFHIMRKNIIEELLRKNRKNAKSAEVDIKNIQKDIDGMVFNIICGREQYDLVRSNTYTYQEIERQYPIFTTRVSNGIELCLRNNTYIQSKILYGGDPIG